MAGHSQFKNIMHRKGAQDAKRAKIFTKIAREITVATKLSGADINSNPRLRSAIQAGRALNMPKDNIERAIKKGAGNLAEDNYDEMRYEGYGPGGVAVIVETLTNNRNRTAANVRSYFSKAGGNLGESNSVAFNFSYGGLITYAKNKSLDEVFELALDCGASDVVEEDDSYEIYTSKEDYVKAKLELEKVLGEAQSAKLAWWANNWTEIIDVDKAASLLKLVETLEDDDDIQHVYTNADIGADIAVALDR